MTWKTKQKKKYSWNESLFGHSHVLRENTFKYTHKHKQTDRHTGFLFCAGKYFNDSDKINKQIGQNFEREKKTIRSATKTLKWKQNPQHSTTSNKQLMVASRCTTTHSYRTINKTKPSRKILQTTTTILIKIYYKREKNMKEHYSIYSE